MQASCRADCRSTSNHACFRPDLARNRFRLSGKSDMGCDSARRSRSVLGVGRRFRDNTCARRRVILATAETRLDRDIENRPDQLQRSYRDSCGNHPCGIFGVCEPVAFTSVRLQHPIRRNAPPQKGRPVFLQMLKIDFSQEPRRLSGGFALPTTLCWPKIGRASLLASHIPAKARPFSKC